MAKRDHDDVRIDKVRGLYTRNDLPSPPIGYLSGAKNVVYSPPVALPPTVPGSVRTREQFKVSSVLPVPNTVIIERFYVYTKSTGNRVIFLEGGRFWDATSGVNILTVTDATDFHGITMNDRFYFTPHNRQTGLPGQFVYVYDPTLASMARKAAGSPMTGTLTTSTGTAGSVEPGFHIIAISHETNTGFKSKPALHIGHTAPATRSKISFPSVPLGPTGTVKRHLWMSKVVRNYDSNPLSVELFLLYTIENNTTTSLISTADAYDSQLVTSADPYTDLLPEIPAGTFLSNFDGRLAVCGAFSATHAFYISNPNEPESVDAVDGVREVLRGDLGAWKTTRPTNTNLAFWKTNKTGILRPNTDVPASWPFEIIDWSLGSEVYGVSESLNLPGPFYGVFLVANQLGLFVFDGHRYVDILSPLSKNIDVDWQCGCVISFLDKIKVIVDPIAFRVYCLLSDASSTKWYVADFADGLNAEGVRWATWDFRYTNGVVRNYTDAHVVIDAALNNISTTLLAIVRSSNNNLYKLITGSSSNGEDEGGGEFEASVSFSIVDDELREIHISSVKMFIGANTTGDTGGLYELRTDNVTQPVNLTAAVAEVMEKFVNSSAYKHNITFSAIGGDFSIAKTIVYVKPVAAEKAQL